MTPTVLLLSLLLSGGLGWENLPAIPAGRRAEYYLLRDDGGYKYGYDTGTGQSAAVSADPSNQVQGQYEYLDKGGRKVSLSYTAGNAGFVPQLQGGNSGPGYGSLSPSFNSASQDSSTVDADYDANADASYSFNIDTDSYKRTETSDSKGNIKGQYSYSSPTGSQSISYIAGEGTGFVASGGDSNTISVSANSAYAAPAPSFNNVYAPAVSTNNAYVPPAQYGYADTNANGKINDDGSYSFSFSTADQSRQESSDAQNNVRGSYSFKAKDDGQTRRVDYTAGSASGFVAHGAHLPVPPSVPSQSLGLSSFPSASSSISQPASSHSYTTSQPSGSYSFSYDSGDHSRQETGDALNNVRGSFSFKAKDDSKIRRVDYEAGAATGFIAKGAHLPVPPSVVGVGYPNPSGGAGYQGGFGTTTSGIAGSSGDYDSQGVVINAYSGTGSGEESTSGDATYSFSYNAKDHSRQEASDAQGNVQGQYSFVASDGVQRKVDYTAGAEKGFVAKGAHLPIAPDASVASTSDQGYSFSGFSNTPVLSYSSTTSGSQAPATSYSSTGPNDDGSYSFSYQAADHSHQQSGDAQNNVRGSFLFKAKDDGQIRRLEYEAGAATGFVAKGAHLPVAPSLSSGYSSFTSQSSGSSYSNANAGVASNALAQTSEPRGDDSYSFSYDAGDHSRDESSDTLGNVRGRFSFIAKDDGQRRQVEYEAGTGKGFIAKGAHIPVSGAGISVPGYQASTYQASNDYQDSAIDAGQRTDDASYSYSYQTDSSSKQESADAQGNVMGRFSYLGGDGVSRSVQYSSRGKDGFIASGAHLPNAGVGGPTVDGLTAQNVGTSAAARYAGASASHVKSHNLSNSEFHLQKYLPPESPKKFGYIFDTRV